ncbi:unnamed protein product [Diatraea saccharalis]|uniref:Uncharacterized protein n=1 Tax=Diatraea saccharalis TaxID=40085 RepID=A0A9N9R5X1_9NEOP|nr:unnamed protein product [Diatraea saccharalis]
MNATAAASTNTMENVPPIFITQTAPPPPPPLVTVPPLLPLLQSIPTVMPPSPPRLPTETFVPTLAAPAVYTAPPAQQANSVQNQPPRPSFDANIPFKMYTYYNPNAACIRTGCKFWVFGSSRPYCMSRSSTSSLQTSTNGLNRLLNGQYATKHQTETTSSVHHRAQAYLSHGVSSTNVASRPTAPASYPTYQLGMPRIAIVQYWKCDGFYPVIIQ